MKQFCFIQHCLDLQGGTIVRKQQTTRKRKVTAWSCDVKVHSLNHSGVEPFYLHVFVHYWQMFTKKNLSGSSGRYHSSQTADYPKKKSDCMIMWRKSAFTKPFWGRTLLSPRFCTLLTNVYKKKSGKTISLYRLALKSFAWFYYCTVRSVVYCKTVLVALFTRYSTADGSQLQLTAVYE